jgi:chlorite dismutase
LMVTFSAGSHGSWRVDGVTSVIGPSLALSARLQICEDESPPATDEAVWQLRGTVSNLRYTSLSDRSMLQASQAGLGRRAATRAALIPIKKNEAWWNLAQDERAAVFHEASRHIEIGARYLPAVARRLHHSRDLGEPFDFLTWFEYAPEAANEFEELVAALRATAEWQYVEREVDIRLSR